MDASHTIEKESAGVQNRLAVRGGQAKPFEEASQLQLPTRVSSTFGCVTLLVPYLGRTALLAYTPLSLQGSVMDGEVLYICVR